MNEITGNIWDYQGRSVIAITTNGQVSKNGRAIMGRGVAAQAAAIFPATPDVLGQKISGHGNHVHYLENNLVSYPVEHSPFEVPDLKLIERSAAELVKMADECGWTSVVVPRPGCGGGGLSWKDVKPLLETHFDSRFSVICPP